MSRLQDFLDREFMKHAKAAIRKCYGVWAQLSKRLFVGWVWFDLWVGAYWDSKARSLYLCPLPTLVLRIDCATSKGELMEAKYNGTCSECGDPIEVGDEIVQDEETEAWVHEECAEGAQGTDINWRKQK